jgi:hypothetical protein
MSYLLNDHTALSAWIGREISVTLPVKKGARGKPARRVQEWLCLHGQRLSIDEDYGRVTETNVARFQEQHNLQSTGAVDERTWHALVAPLRRVLQPVDMSEHAPTLPAIALAYARQHLREHPLETGGQNRGPWVRLYMKGNEGAQWAWCAGFVSFVLHQAAETLRTTPPIQGSFSCDTLAAQAKAAGRFAGESSVAAQLEAGALPPVAAIFLVRRTPGDWTHTGFVTGFTRDSFTTIEGNTNDDGSREGYEVCSLTRGYAKKDFIALAGARES